jgi:hypothetical protein
MPWLIGKLPPEAKTTENGMKARAVTTAASTTIYATGAPSIAAPPKNFTERSSPEGCAEDMLAFLSLETRVEHDSKQSYEFILASTFYMPFLLSLLVEGNISTSTFKNINS